MKPPKLILDHVHDPDSFAYRENKLTPLTKAMAVSMLATGMSRLYTADDFREFFTRLAIFYREEGFIESYFTSDELTLFLFDGSRVKASVRQIMHYKGIQLDSGGPNMSFESWLEGINHIYLVLKVMSMKRNYSNMDYTYKELLEDHADTLKIEVNADHISDARFMTNTIFKDLS